MAEVSSPIVPVDSVVMLPKEEALTLLLIAECSTPGIIVVPACGDIVVVDNLSDMESVSVLRPYSRYSMSHIEGTVHSWYIAMHGVNL